MMDKISSDENTVLVRLTKEEVEFLWDLCNYVQEDYIWKYEDEKAAKVIDVQIWLDELLKEME